MEPTFDVSKADTIQQSLNLVDLLVISGNDANVFGTAIWSHPSQRLQVYEHADSLVTIEPARELASRSSLAGVGFAILLTFDTIPTEWHTGPRETFPLQPAF